MLDIKFIRENTELIKAAARKKHLVVDLEALLLVDDRRRSILAAVEEMRAKQNEYNGLIVKSTDGSERSRMIAEMKVAFKRPRRNDILTSTFFASKKNELLKRLKI